MLEKLFEGAIWRSRLIVLLAVIFGLLGAIILFIIASLDIWNVAVMTLQVVTHAILPYRTLNIFTKMWWPVLSERWISI